MAIPKVINYCWFGGGEKSDLIKRCIESWHIYAKNCEIVEWNEHNYDIQKNRYMKEAYNEKRWGFVPDYARLDIVYENGGIYFDTDVELVRPIDELLEGTGFCGFEQSHNKEIYYVNTGSGFGAEKNNPVIKIMRDEYDELSFYTADGQLNLTPSPIYNSTALERVGLKLNNAKQLLEGGITVYPYEYFCPVDWETHRRVITDNTFSIHHFDASWLTENEKKQRKRMRRTDRIIHLPNALAKMILGEEAYAKLKRFVKR